ncbi:MAG TPA: pyruvoyl-dependent arginine decarboxylase [Methanoregula sp.]|nr:pyruvoyl-dependent arginine decarboxylase [Methanoregula sp.]
MRFFLEKTGFFVSGTNNLKKRNSPIKAMYVPKEIFFTKGVGVHKDRLASFELALRKAGIEKCNLVYVSSIFPPQLQTDLADCRSQ